MHLTLNDMLYLLVSEKYLSKVLQKTIGLDHYCAKSLHRAVAVDCAQN